MVNVAPEAKLTAVRDVPTELPAWNNSIPETTPVNSLPSPCSNPNEPVELDEDEEPKDEDGTSVTIGEIE